MKRWEWWSPRLALVVVVGGAVYFGVMFGRSRVHEQAAEERQAQLEERVRAGERTLREVTRLRETIERSNSERVVVVHSSEPASPPPSVPPGPSAAPSVPPAPEPVPEASVPPAPEPDPPPTFCDVFRIVCDFIPDSYEGRLV